MFLINWISQSSVALYIYRAGWTYPTRNPFYRSESIKNLILLGLLLDRSDRSVSCRAGYSAQPVRPLGQTGPSRVRVQLGFFIDLDL